jgi:hypothetical protein
VSGVVGEAGDGDSGGLVGGVAETDGAGFARCSGDGGGAAHGGDLFGVVASFEQWPDLGDEVGKADVGDPREVLEQHGLGWAASASRLSRSSRAISALRSRM